LGALLSVLTPAACRDSHYLVFDSQAKTGEQLMAARVGQTRTTTRRGDSVSIPEEDTDDEDDADVT
jgi:hypothetical protein